MINIIIFALLYNAIFQILSLEFDIKIAQNFTSGIHLFICLALNIIFFITDLLWIYKLAATITIGHYLFDIFYLLNYKKMNLMTGALIYHHLATIFYVQYDPYLYLNYLVLIFAEISNIPALFIYHYLKTDPSNTRLKFWQYIQKLVYIIIRIPLFTGLSYYIWINTHDILALSICSPVFLMGIIWSFKLLQQKN